MPRAIRTLRWIAHLSLVAAAASIGPAGRSAESADPLVARLQGRLDRIRTVSGRFVQSLDSASLGRPRTETGRFMISKPDRMRWEYESPERKLAVIDGTHTWLYLPDEAEVHRGSASGVRGSGAPALLLTGAMRLDRDFLSRRPGPKELAAELPLPEGSVVVELTPKRPDPEFQKVLLAIHPDRLQILKVILVDPLGDRMSFTFSDMEEDTPLPDSLFRFEPPPGVRVVDTEKPQR